MNVMKIPTRPIAAHQCNAWGGSVLCAAGLLFIAAVTCFYGCTTEKRYEILKVLFDGVPNPNAPKVASSSKSPNGSAGGANAGVAQPVAFMHKPYQENKCDACHGSSSGKYSDYQKIGADVCLKCHEKVLTAYPVMHGPVTSVECNLCHTPHESTIRGLLKQSAPTVCTQCHVTELLSGTTPAHLQPDSQCLQCHVGHGGNEHKLLRPRQPTTRLAISPAIGGKP
jgi:predicted CXXCH cytochrome family protein